MTMPASVGTIVLIHQGCCAMKQNSGPTFLSFSRWTKALALIGRLASFGETALFFWWTEWWLFILRLSTRLTWSWLFKRICALLAVTTLVSLTLFARVSEACREAMWPAGVRLMTICLRPFSIHILRKCVSERYESWYGAGRTASTRYGGSKLFYFLMTNIMRMQIANSSG